MEVVAREWFERRPNDPNDGCDDSHFGLSPRSSEQFELASVHIG